MSAAETRRRLMEATVALLVEQGVRGVRVSEIAARADVSTGAIYSQFSSKSDLLITAVREHAPMVIAEHLASGEHSSILELFAEVGRSLPERAAELGPLLLEIIVAATHDEEIAALVGAQFAENETNSTVAIRLAQNAGEIDGSIDAAALGRFLSMVSLGSLVTAALSLPDVDTEAWGTLIGRLLDSARPDDAT